MSFEQKVPEWKNSGTEPSESLKNTGFVGGYKPPASVFNWFWYRVIQCLKELQGMTPDDIGALSASKVVFYPNSTSNIETGVASAENKQLYYLVKASDGTKYRVDITPNMLRYRVIGSDGSVISDIAENLNSLKTTAKTSLVDAINELFDTTPIKRGGTGATDRKEAMYNIACLGVEPIDSPAKDTIENWNALGTGYAWYGSDGRLKDQPTSYALLVNVVYGFDLTQFWIAHPIGRVYKRSGSSAGWNGTWFKVYDEKNKPTPTEIGAANTAFSNIPDTSAALYNLHVTSNFKGTVDGTEYTFNTALTQAEYSVAGTDIDGAPTTGTIYGKLVVIVNSGTTHNNSSNWIWQVFYSTLTGRIYMRSKVNDGAWSTWAAIYNQNNKPAPLDIGAAKLYTNLSDLGLSQSTATPLDIFNKMADCSIGLYAVGTDWNADAVPEQYGTLFVARRTSSRGLFIFREIGGKHQTWTGSLNTTNGVSFSGWVQLYDAINNQIEVLWENASPTSNFAAQTISLDLSKYDAVLITMCTGNSASNIGSYLFEVGSGTHITYGAGAYMGRRNYKVTTTGVIVEGGSKYESAWADSNAYQKPLKIYGLKGVQ